MAASSNVIELFTHPIAQRRARRPQRVFSVYEEELESRARAERRFTAWVFFATAALVVLLVLAV